MKDAIDVRRLAVVLRHANTQPPPGELAREAFYRMKQVICEQYGSLDGYDVQRIAHKCWGRPGYGCDDDCDRCGGSGIYQERRYLLQRWRLGGLVFHRPIDTPGPLMLPPTIEGKIRHKPSKLAAAARRALELAFTGSWGLYASVFALDDAELRRFKAALTYLLGIDRRRWPGVRLRLPEIEAKAKQLESAAIPF